MSAVLNRIVPAPACEVINLTEPEKDIYSDAGWHMAAFNPATGTLKALKSFLDVPYHSADGVAEDRINFFIEQCAKEDFEILREWADDQLRDGNEVWIVMCSCYQLCEPFFFDPSDPLVNAKLIRRIADQLKDYYDD